MKRLYYRLKIDVFRNSSQKKLSVLRVALRHPYALLAKTMTEVLGSNYYLTFHSSHIGQGIPVIQAQATPSSPTVSSSQQSVMSTETEGSVCTRAVICRV